MAKSAELGYEGNPVNKPDGIRDKLRKFLLDQGVRDCFSCNFAEDWANLQRHAELEETRYVAFDAEFQKCHRPIPREMESELDSSYRFLKTNVDVCCMSEMGFCFFDKNGKKVTFNNAHSYQFNIQGVQSWMTNPNLTTREESACQMLRDAGVSLEGMDCKDLRKSRIQHSYLKKKLLSSLNTLFTTEKLTWLVFHGDKDVAFFMKELIYPKLLPDTRLEFLQLLCSMLPRIIDVKHVYTALYRKGNSLKNLQTQYKITGITGFPHSSSHDAEATGAIYFTIQRKEQFPEDQFLNVVYNLGHTWAPWQEMPYKYETYVIYDQPHSGIEQENIDPLPTENWTANEFPLPEAREFFQEIQEQKNRRPEVDDTPSTGVERFIDTQNVTTFQQETDERRKFVDSILTQLNSDSEPAAVVPGNLSEFEQLPVVKPKDERQFTPQAYEEMLQQNYEQQQFERLLLDDEERQKNKKTESMQKQHQPEPPRNAGGEHLQSLRQASTSLQQKWQQERATTIQQNKCLEMRLRDELEKLSQIHKNAPLPQQQQIIPQRLSQLGQELEISLQLLNERYEPQIAEIEGQITEINNPSRQLVQLPVVPLQLTPYRIAASPPQLSPRFMQPLQYLPTFHQYGSLPGLDLPPLIPPCSLQESPPMTQSANESTGDEEDATRNPGASNIH